MKVREFLKMPKVLLKTTGNHSTIKDISLLGIAV